MPDSIDPSVLRDSISFVNNTRTYHLNSYPCTPDMMASLAKNAIDLNHRLGLALEHIEKLQTQVRLLQSEIASPTS